MNAEELPNKTANCKYANIHINGAKYLLPFICSVSIAFWMVLKCMFLYWKTLLHTHSLYQRSPSASVHAQDFQRITFKTENNRLANIDSCWPLELCLSTGQIIASSLCICRNQVIRGLSLVIFFSCGPPASEVFLFIAKFKVHVQWLVLLAPWMGRPYWEGRRVVVM